MKNKKLKLYIVTFYLYSNVALFAASRLGSNSSTGNLEEEDAVTTTQQAAPLPINHYLWVLALIGLMYGFIKFRTYQNSKIE